MREFRQCGSSPRAGLDYVAQSRCPQNSAPRARTGSPESPVDACTVNQDHPNNPLNPIHRDNPNTLFAPLNRPSGSGRESESAATLFYRTPTMVVVGALAVADQLSPARRTARASSPVTPAACSSPARRLWPLPRVSSVHCAWALLCL